MYIHKKVYILLISYMYVDIFIYCKHIYNIYEELATMHNIKKKLPKNSETLMDNLDGYVLPNYII